jgi:DNA-directed RNA polymerase beta' subunit
MQQNKSLVAPIRTVRACSFSPRSDADTLMAARARVQSSQMNDMGKPHPGGISDANMGTTEGTHVCATCRLDKRHCHGHPGIFHLNYPMFNPSVMPEVIKWLRVICFNCGSLIFTDDEIRNHCGANPTLSNLAKAVPNHSRPCPHCGAMHHVVRRQDKTSWSFIVRGTSAEGGSTGESIMRALDVAQIFDHITDETLKKVDRNALAHPRKFIWNELLVPSPVMRPDMKRVGGRGSGNDSLTAHLKAIIEYHQKSPLRSGVPIVISVQVASAINDLNTLIADMLITKNDHAKSIGDRFRTKNGRLRGNILGKRVHGMGRSTIDGSPVLKLDEISIPLFIAQTLAIYEKVQDFNRERLMRFVMNGPDHYPGCSRIIKKNGAEYRPMPGMIVENGDTVVRDLIDGDIVAFNRQPTLTISGITAMRVVIDRGAYANGMNVLICALFGADFDGDQMNIFNYAYAASLNEQLMLASVNSRMVSYTTGTISIKQVGDSLTGMMKITQSGVRVNKYHACLVYATTITTPDIEGAIRETPGDARVLSGRDLVSLTFAHTPLNYRGKSGYYDPNAAWGSLIDARDPACMVEIVSGKLRSGCLDQGSMGANRGSMYQSLVHEYGAARTLDVIYDHQQVGINYMAQAGFTTGIRDFLISRETREKVHDIARETLMQAHNLADRLRRGAIIPPVDQSVTQTYEMMQIALQRINDSYARVVFSDIKNPRENGIFEMMAIGKGSPTFLVNMCATVGLIMINGARASLNFGYGRSLPYFQRFDESPESRGFSAESFISGLSLVGSIFNAMMSRTDIISRALFTSITGDNNRKSIKSLESVITNNFRMNMKGASIVSFVYGGDYLDPRSLETVTYAPAMMSRAKFEEMYRGVDDAEFAQLEKDRAEYRRIRRHAESLSLRDRMNGSMKLPINIPRMISHLREAIIRHAERISEATANSRVSSDDELREVARGVAQFCADLPYLYINEIQRARRSWIPAFTSAAATYLQMYVRSELCSAKIRAVMRDPILARVGAVGIARSIIEGVSSLITLALVDPGCAVGIIAAQSFCEPFTQDMLDSYKTSALTGGNAGRTKMSKCREVMAAYSVSKLSAPSMTIMLDDEFARDENNARGIAQQIEMLRFSQLVDSSQIFAEQFANPTHPAFAGEREYFATFATNYPLYPPPGDLMSWCLRFALNKEMLVQKNISVEVIIGKLRARYTDLYFVHTTERAPVVYIRAYIRAGAKVAQMVATDMDDGSLRVEAVSRRHVSNLGINARVYEFYQALLETIIRGVDGITITRVEKMLRTREAEDGAIVDAADIYCIRTVGTNLPRVSRIAGVNANLVQTDAIVELAEFLGIEVARSRIIIEMRGLVEKCDVRHYMIYADEMTRTGRVTSIERSGLSMREMSNVALRAGQASPVQVFTEAALSARRDVITGVSGPITYGQVPRLGTLYNTFIMDADVVRKYKKSARQIAEEL